MNETQFDALQSEAEKTYLRQLSAGGPPGHSIATMPVGLDIVSILMAVLSAILGACSRPQTAAQLKTACDSPSRWTLFQIETALRRELRDRHGWGAWREYDGPAIAATALVLVRSQPVEMLEACCRQCR